MFVRNYFPVDRYIILKELFNFFGWKCYTMHSMKEQHIAQNKLQKTEMRLNRIKKTRLQYNKKEKFFFRVSSR